MSGVEVGTAYLSIVPSAKGFGSKLTQELGGAGAPAGDAAAKGFGSKFSSGIATAAKVGALGLVAAAAGAVGFAKDAVSEARESQKVGALTESIIKSTGGAAKITADQVGNLATAISNKTGIDDEAIQSGANMLLTFKNVKNEVGEGANVFDRATAAATDLSAAGFGDMAGQSKMLGKALNDPIKGISALARSGVTFTAQQKEQIKTLVESGKTLDAQKIILGEVESQVGGAAAASATMGEKLSTAFGNFKEQIGTALLPVIDKVEAVLVEKVIPAVSDFVQGLQDGTGAGGRFRDFLSNAWTVLSTLGGSVVALTGFLRDNADVIGIVATVLGAVMIPRLIAWGIQSTIAAAKSVVAWISTQAAATASAITTSVTCARIVGYWALMALQSTLNAGKMAISWLVGIVTPAVGAVVSMAVTAASVVAGWVLMGVQSLLQAARMAAAWLIALGPVGWIIAAVVALAALIIANWDTIKKWTIIAWTAVKNALAAAWNWIKTTAIALFNGVRDFIVSVWLTVKMWTLAVWNGITGGLAAAFNWIRNAAVAIFNAVRGYIVAQWNAIKAATVAVWNGIKSAIGAVWNGIKTVVSGAVDAVKKTLGAAWTAVSGAVSTAWTSISRGVSGGLDSVAGVVKGLPGKITTALGNLGSLLLSAGSDVIGGFISGIQSAAGGIISAVRGAITDKLPSFVKDALGINSPSRVFMEIGGHVGDGMALGIANKVGAVAKAAGKLNDAAIIDPLAPVATVSAIGAASARRVAATEIRSSSVAAPGRGLDMSETSMQRLAAIVRSAPMVAAVTTTQLDRALAAS